MQFFILYSKIKIDYYNIIYNLLYNYIILEIIKYKIFYFLKFNKNCKFEIAKFFLFFCLKNNFKSHRAKSSTIVILYFHKNFEFFAILFIKNLFNYSEFINIFLVIFNFE